MSAFGGKADINTPSLDRLSVAIIGVQFFSAGVGAGGVPTFVEPPVPTAVIACRFEDTRRRPIRLSSRASASYRLRQPELFIWAGAVQSSRAAKSYCFAGRALVRKT